MKTETNNIFGDFIRRTAVMLSVMLMTAATAWAQHQPDRCLDACTGGAEFIHIQGWAYDPDAPAQSLTLHLYIYTDADCTRLIAYSHELKANVPRPDVNSAKGITGNHGFIVDIPIVAGNYWVKIFAIDTNGDGNSQIGSTTKVTVKALVATVTLNENSGDVTLQDGDVVTGTGGGNTHLMIADGATVTLNNVTNTAISHKKHWPGIDCQGDATIILSGENAAKGDNQYPGVYVPEGKTLTIRGNGSLTATAIEAAGIGTSYGPSSTYSRCGNIVIAGGIVTANHEGRYAGTGIGSGIYGSCGDITITGGIVTATGNNDSAGIGGAEFGSCGNITITGGTITATGSGYAAGIGSGYGGSCGNITISDGVTTVTATAGNEAPYCIGAGLSDNFFESTCGAVTINGFETGNVALRTYTYVPSETTVTGTVTFDANGGTGTMANQTIYSNIPEPLTANSFKCLKHFFIGWNTATDGSGIGYNDGQIVMNTSSMTLYAQWNGDYIDLQDLQDLQVNDIEIQDNQTISGTGGGDIHITIADGATVMLDGVDITQIDSEHQWAGITCLGNATIILADGSTNNVKGGRRSAGIFVPEGKTLTICGDGSLTAMGNDYATGIGGNSQTPCGNILIAGGSVTATSGQYAAGIGSGWKGSCGDITITGGSVTATGGLNTAGIGSGEHGSCGDITITGGSITAIGGKNTAAAIGCGFGNSSNPSSCGNITITGGVTSVIATKTKDSDKVHIIGSCGTYGTCGTITIDPSLMDVLSNENKTRTLYPGITFAKEGYSTYFDSEHDATLPTGMKARIVTTDEGNGTLTYETIADGDTEEKTVPASTAVMLQVAGGTSTQTIGLSLTSPSAAAISQTNLLHGSDDATTTTGDGLHYKLSYGTDELATTLGWYWGAADGAAFTSAAHKAWLALPSGSPARLRLPDSDDGVVTGIVDIEHGTWNIEHSAGAWYSLDGRRLNGKPSAKGLYIHNGNKVVIK